MAVLFGDGQTVQIFHGKYAGRRGTAVKVAGTGDDARMRVQVENGPATWVNGVELGLPSATSTESLQNGLQHAPAPAAGAESVFFSSTVPPTAEQVERLADIMPPLAGRRLEAPVFHRTHWQAGQCFSGKDDPDRTNEPWEPPQFVREADPEIQRAKTTVDELSVPRSSPGSRFAKVVRGELGEDDCAALLASVNRKGFTPALLNVGVDLQQLRPEVRDGHRVIVDSPALASWLFEVIRPHLPEELADGSRIVELNERLRFLCYTPGQSFDVHCDGAYRRPRGHPHEGDQSRITVQLYLHDVPEPYGGATTFYPDRSCAAAHQPEVGSVLLFTQDLPHEGSLVKDGLKYTVRTDVMYSRPKRAWNFGAETQLGASG